MKIAQCLKMIIYQENKASHRPVDENILKFNTVSGISDMSQTFANDGICQNLYTNGYDHIRGEIIKVHDENNIPKYIEMLEELTSTIEVGIFGEDDQKSYRSQMSEFGCNIRVTDKMRNYLHVMGLHLKKSTQEIRIPERSFICLFFDSKEKKSETQQQAFGTSIKHGPKVDTFFKTLGEYIVGQLQEYIRYQNPTESSVYN